MSEIKEEAYVSVIIKAHCSKCGAEMRKQDLGMELKFVAGKLVKKHAHRFLYVCPSCGAEKYSNTDYPRVEYHRIKLKAPAELNGGAR